MKTTVKPLNDRVLVKRIEPEQKLKGGSIIIPDTAKEKPLEGKVVAVGAGRLDDNGKRVALDVKAGDRVLVKRIEPEEKVKGGIIIPDTAKEKPLEGKVVAIGAGKLDEDGKRIPLEVKVGDRVLIGKYIGTEVKIDDVEHVIVKEEEILGIIS